MAIPQEEDVLPWKETSIETERLQFIERHCAGEETVAELCREFGISRKTGHKLISRYESYGEGGLLDLSRAPHHHPNATPTRTHVRSVKRSHAAGPSDLPDPMSLDITEMIVGDLDPEQSCDGIVAVNPF